MPNPFFGFSSRYGGSDPRWEEYNRILLENSGGFTTPVPPPPEYVPPAAVGFNPVVAGYRTLKSRAEDAVDRIRKHPVVDFLVGPLTHDQVKTEDYDTLTTGDPGAPFTPEEFLRHDPEYTTKLMPEDRARELRARMRGSNQGALEGANEAISKGDIATLGVGAGARALGRLPRLAKTAGALAKAASITDDAAGAAGLALGGTDIALGTLDYAEDPGLAPLARIGGGAFMASMGGLGLATHAPRESSKVEHFSGPKQQVYLDPLADPFHVEPQASGVVDGQAGDQPPGRFVKFIQDIDGSAEDAVNFWRNSMTPEQRLSVARNAEESEPVFRSIAGQLLVDADMADPVILKDHYWDPSKRHESEYSKGKTAAMERMVDDEVNAMRRGLDDLQNSPDDNYGLKWLDEVSQQPQSMPAVGGPPPVKKSRSGEWEYSWAGRNPQIRRPLAELTKDPEFQEMNTWLNEFTKEMQPILARISGAVATSGVGVPALRYAGPGENRGSSGHKRTYGVNVRSSGSYTHEAKKGTNFRVNDIMISPALMAESLMRELMSATLPKGDAYHVGRMQAQKKEGFAKAPQFPMMMDSYAKWGHDIKHRMLATMFHEMAHATDDLSVHDNWKGASTDPETFEYERSPIGTADRVNNPTITVPAGKSRQERFDMLMSFIRSLPEAGKVYDRFMAMGEANGLNQRWGQYIRKLSDASRLTDRGGVTPPYTPGEVRGFPGMAGNHPGGKGPSGGTPGTSGPGPIKYLDDDPELVKAGVVPGKIWKDAKGQVVQVRGVWRDGDSMFIRVSGTDKINVNMKLKDFLLGYQKVELGNPTPGPVPPKPGFKTQPPGPIPPKPTVGPTSGPTPPPTGGQGPTPPPPPVTGGQGPPGGPPQPPKKKRTPKAPGPVYPELTKEQWLGKREAIKYSKEVLRRELRKLGAFDWDVNTFHEFESNPNDPKFARIKKLLQDMYALETAVGLPVKQRQGYLPHYWEDPPQVKPSTARKVGARPGFVDPRKHKTYAEGIAAGLKPKYTNMGDLILRRYGASLKGQADRQLWNHLKQNKLIAPITSKRARQEGYETLDPKHLPLHRVRKKKKDKLIQAYGTTPEIARYLHNYLKPDDESTWRKLAKINTNIKNIILSGGIPGTGINFHGIQNIRGRHASATGLVKGNVEAIKWLTRPKKARAFLDTNYDQLPQAVSDGLVVTTEEHGVPFHKQLAGWKTEWEAYKKKGLKGKVIRGPGQLASLMRIGHGILFEDPLFQNVIPAFKLKFYMENKAAMGGPAAASKANEIYGGINYLMEGRSKDTQAALRAVLLAPDWAETHYRLAKGTLKALRGPKTPESRLYRSLVYRALIAYALKNAVQIGMTGEPTQENQRGHETSIDLGKAGSKKRYFVHGGADDFMKIPYDVMSALVTHNLDRIPEIVGGRLSPLVQAGIKVATNKDHWGKKILSKDLPPLKEMGNLAAEVGEVTLPQYVQGPLEHALGRNETWEETFAESFEIPLRYPKERHDSKTGPGWDFSKTGSSKKRKKRKYKF